MKTNNLCIIRLTVGLLLITCAVTVPAGNLDSAAAPENSGSAMYTLSDLYQRLNNGTAGTKRSGSFILPAQGPTSGTMYTLDQIMALMPEQDASGASASDVVSGKPFWGLTAGQWGPGTGSMANPSLSADSTVVSAGYYAAGNLTAVDPDLTAGNIATNVTLFGIAGTAETNCSSGGGADSAPVPKTGQTTYYTYYSAVTGTGTDGDLQMGVTWPDPRFAIQSNTNVVLDNLTGLMWAVDANMTGSITWNSAIDFCNNLDYGGYDDWRMPDINELLSLIAYNRNNPALPAGHPFLNAAGVNYWTSTTYAGATTYAYYVSMLDALVNTYLKTSTLPVWPVRGGE